MGERTHPVKAAVVASLLLAFGNAGAAAQDASQMKPPRLSYAQVDWPAAVASLSDVEALGPTTSRLGLRSPGPARRSYPALTRLNAVMSAHFAGLAASPVPVLVPFDVTARLQDQADGKTIDEARYLGGFHAAKFFYSGPAGYDAAFAIRGSDVPELADSKYPHPIEVQISGSVLLYELDAPIVAEGQAVPALEDAYPGIRRTLLEHHLRYTFVRFGVPYAVSIGCLETGSTRQRMPSCRVADHVAHRFLRALRVAGGQPRPARTPEPSPIDRPAQLSQSFSFHPPGQIRPGTGFRGQGGRQDYTVYSQIRFPLAEAPALAKSELNRRNSQVRISDPSNAFAAPAAHIPWRDNFCERRGFSVSQCPAGIGHQGQDVRPLICRPAPNSDRCDPPGDIVAVRDGVILRSPHREAAYLFVNSANEHIRFRYLHMNPQKMDADHLLSGRRVHEGEVIGEVSNFSAKDAGTSYHLHFDIQVPTKLGWVFVNPYMTLVAAYERLIGERGTEIGHPPPAVPTDPEATASTGGSEPSRVQSWRAKQSRWIKSDRNQWRQSYVGR